MIPFDLVEARDTGAIVTGTTQSGKTTLAKHLVERLTDNGDICYVLDISQAWPNQCSIDEVVEIPPNSTSIQVPTHNSAVIDLSALEYTKRIKYVIAFCKAIYAHNVSYGFKRAPQKYIVFEEGHTYFYNGVFRSPRVFSPCIDIVTVGANFNLRFLAVTQFPAMIDKALVKVCQQRYFGWSTEMNDLNYIKAFVGKQYVTPTNKDGSPNENSVFNLRKGQFLYQLRNKIEKIQSAPYVPRRNSYNVNETPIPQYSYSTQLSYTI